MELIPYHEIAEAQEDGRERVEGRPEMRRLLHHHLHRSGASGTHCDNGQLHEAGQTDALSPTTGQSNFFNFNYFIVSGTKTVIIMISYFMATTVENCDGFIAKTGVV